MVTNPSDHDPATVRLIPAHHLAYEPQPDRSQRQTPTGSHEPLQPTSQSAAQTVSYPSPSEATDLSSTLAWFPGFPCGFALGGR